jgi:penicillin-binding protein 2
MALAALTTGKRAASTLINDPGFFMFGGHRFGSPENEKGGIMDMRRAIVESSNAYFYSLANELGVDTIHDFMAPLGFGQITGIDINGEVRGVLPSQEWKRHYYKRPEQQKWYPGETISLGIGQGYNSFTMLQLAQATAILANNGIKHKPHLVMATQDATARVSVPVPLDPPENLGLKPEHMAIVRDAMVGVTQGGTSTRVFAGAPYISGGKTGTAQAVSLGKNEKYNAAHMEERRRDHSLYIAFAPAEDPKMAIAVIVENAGFGAASAAPIARRAFDYWLLGQYPNEADMAAVRSGLAAAPVGKPLLASEVPWPRGAASAATPASAPDAASSATQPASAAVAASAAVPVSRGR